jgi:transitional endoplasmic reticulum ATPase
MQSTLSRGQQIDGKFEVAFFLKKGSYAETYRVKDSAGKTKFLKLFSHDKLAATQFDDEGRVLEIALLEQIDHPNIAKLESSGELTLDGSKYSYGIFEFISGETLADRMRRNQTLNPYEAKEIIAGVLEGMSYLHSLERPIVHNEITNLNVMTDLSGDTPLPKIIDFGYARYADQPATSFMKEGLNPFYLASESFELNFSPRSDVFAVGALYYHLLFGIPPWFITNAKLKTMPDALEAEVIHQRRQALRFLNVGSSIDMLTQTILAKSLQPNENERFANATEFLAALQGNVEIEVQAGVTTTTQAQKRVPKVLQEGEGFQAIAGMQELKDTIRLDVIDALNDPETYASYGLTIPNGMMLYGPPGCGKTFFAQRMAEEIGFNYYQINPSDIQSKWVNASQENVKNLFEDARQNAPSIIFIDELDALVPRRDDKNVNFMNTSAVNEFLAQMNNTGESNVFIIGATNRPTAIDPAILRSGRLDKHVYLPPPDFEARRLMFELYLDKRPHDTLDYVALAEATENYVSSDIKFLCDEAARTSLKQRSNISQEVLLQTINNTKPSISLQELRNYEAIKANMDRGRNEATRRSIGFKKH